MVVGKAANAADTRFQAAKGLRPRANKVFPEHFSFLFGEIALYSLMVLLVSGTYLALFFDPSLAEVTYRGGYVSLQEVEMSRAYETSLNLSISVRGGLLVRQVHHWAALIFIAAMFIHMLRIFFTGAFRKPRELNWMIGVFLLILALLEAYFGYSMLDDVLSGVGVRIFSGILMSIPVIGTWLHWGVFGGEFPGEIFISRFFTMHVFVLPALILALVAVHLAAVWYQEHTQYAGRRRKESNVVGTRTVPAFAMKSTGLASAVAAVLVLMGGLLQINPVFNYGPYGPAESTVNSQPDWYLLFIIGALRLFPSWEPVLFGQWRIPEPFWAGVVLPLTLFAILFAYPFVERRLTKDYSHHNLLQRPRDAPVRTGFGVALLTFYLILVVAGADDVLAVLTEVSIETFVWTSRVGVLVLPPLAFLVTYLLCVRLQRADRDTLLHGVESGVIEQREHGYYVAVRQRLHTDSDATERPRYAGARLPSLPGELDTVPADRRGVPAGQNRAGDAEAGET